MADTGDADDTWLITRAVVRGTGHVKLGTPCQDYCEARLSRDGRWLVAAVCDGAGSASRSDEGAQVVAEAVTAGLIAEISTIETLGPGVWLKDRVHAILLGARQHLRSRGGAIRDFNCTLVGVLIGPTGGFFFHVGDGAGVASRAVLKTEADGDSVQDRLFVWEDLVISPPENGEVANETYFVTQDEWDKHLRSKSIPSGADIVMLMSDGGMEFVLPRQQINPSWITPVIGQLLKTDDDDARSRLVEGYLADPEAAPVTSDDKTIFIAMRRRLLAQAGLALSKAAPVTTEPPVPSSSGQEKFQPSGAHERGEPSREIATPPVRPPPMWRQVVPAPRPDARATIALVLSGVALIVAVLALAVSLWPRRDPAPPPPAPPAPAPQTVPAPGPAPAVPGPSATGGGTATGTDASPSTRPDSPGTRQP